MTQEILTRKRKGSGNAENPQTFDTSSLRNNSFSSSSFHQLIQAALTSENGSYSKYESNSGNGNNYNSLSSSSVYGVLLHSNNFSSYTENSPSASPPKRQRTNSSSSIPLSDSISISPNSFQEQLKYNSISNSLPLMNRSLNLNTSPVSDKLTIQESKEQCPVSSVKFSFF